MVKTKNKKNNNYIVFLIIFTIFLFLLVQWRYYNKNNDLENWERVSLSPEYIAESQKNTKITPDNLLD